MFVRAANRASLVNQSRRFFFSELGFMEHKETLLLQSIKDGIYHRSAYLALQKANQPKFTKPSKDPKVPKSTPGNDAPPGISSEQK
jgi:hypothetical protein